MSQSSHGQRSESALLVWECPACGSLDTERSRCESLADHDRRRVAVRVFREAAVERAWRNGWGSALNMLRAADSLVLEHTPLKGKDSATSRIILDLVGQWVEIIDGLTETVIAKAHEVGIASAPRAAESVAAGHEHQQVSANVVGGTR